MNLVCEIKDPSAYNLRKSKKSSNNLMYDIVVSALRHGDLIENQKEKNDYIFVKSFGERRRDILKEAIENLADLEQSLSYNGYDSLDQKCINLSIKFLNDLNDFSVEKISDLFPTPNGTISIIWENKKTDSIASLEIGDEQFSYYFKESADKKAEFLMGVPDSETIAKIEKNIKSI